MNSANDLLKRRWLVVDDHASVAMLISIVLRRLGMAEVDECHSPLDAMVQTERERFELIITDRDMPGLDGLEFARRVRAQSPATRIIMVTANPYELSPNVLRDAGISALVDKPFSIVALERIVLRVMGAVTEGAPFRDGWSLARHAA